MHRDKYSVLGRCLCRFTRSLTTLKITEYSLGLVVDRLCEPAFTSLPVARAFDVRHKDLIRFVIIQLKLLQDNKDTLGSKRIHNEDLVSILKS